MSLLEEERAATGSVNATHLAAAVFELAEKRALEIHYAPRIVTLTRRQQPIETLDAVQEHLLECIITRGVKEVKITQGDRGKFGAVVPAMNRFLSSRSAPNPRRRGERARERERRAVQDSALSLHLWLEDGATAHAMQPCCNEWVASKRDRPEWWICQGRWPGEHGNLLALTYGMLVQSFT